MVSEIILGLDWLMNNEAVVDTPKMQLIFPDGTSKSLFIFDSSVKDPSTVVLEEDVEIPGKHEVFQTARIKNPVISESVLEPNMSLFNLLSTMLFCWIIKKYVYDGLWLKYMQTLWQKQGRK